MSADDLDGLLYCGRGVCAAMEGHEGTCDEASGWAIDPQEKRDALAYAALRRVILAHKKRDPQREFDMAEPS